MHRHKWVVVETIGKVTTWKCSVCGKGKVTVK